LFYIFVVNTDTKLLFQHWLADAKYATETQYQSQKLENYKKIKTVKCMMAQQILLVLLQCPPLKPLDVGNFGL